VPSADEKTGLGVIGTLSSPMRYEDFLSHVRDILDCSYVRYTRAPKEMIKRVALCGGSGAEFIPEAIRQGADVYITADCKYHEFQDAEGVIGLIDIDHWSSERHAREIFRDILAPLGVQCLVSKTDKTPILIFNPS
jgi:putative NIF3 family GTP cyclohydrolase 1 type 2